MLLKVLALSLLISLTTALPELFCDEPEPGLCRISNVYLRQDQPNYSVYSSEPNQVTRLEIVNSTLTVFSEDFCKALPNLQVIIAEGQKIAVLAPNSLESCFKLEHLALIDNLIEVLPENLLRNNLKLTLLNFGGNLIQHVPSSFLENNVQLYGLQLYNNKIAEFSPSILRTNARITGLFLQTNNIFDLDVVGLVETLPILSYIAINGNLFPCTRLTYILDVLHQRDISLEKVQFSRERIFRMNNVDDVACIDGQ